MVEKEITFKKFSIGCDVEENNNMVRVSCIAKDNEGKELGRSNFEFKKETGGWL